jgi:hypothetical protein
MVKTILNIGKAVILISAIALIAALIMVRNPHTFETGATVGFYGFLTFLVAGVITLIAKIIVSQRG